MQTKSQLRDELKAKRWEMPVFDRQCRANKITEYLTEILEPYSTVLAYASKEPEADTSEIINILIAENKKIIVPIIESKTKTLRFSYLTSLSDLEPGTFNVPEPLTSEKPADPEIIEAAFLPMVGFDRFGSRLGYGAGYYDRFLKNYPKILKIGVAYSCQEADMIPCEPFDIKMDIIVTDKEIIRIDKEMPAKEK